jgi:hypothetical protein
MLAISYCTGLNYNTAHSALAQALLSQSQAQITCDDHKRPLHSPKRLHVMTSQSDAMNKMATDRNNHDVNSGETNLQPDRPDTAYLRS